MQVANVMMDLSNLLCMATSVTHADSNYLVQTKCKGMIFSWVDRAYTYQRINYATKLPRMNISQTMVHTV